MGIGAAVGLGASALLSRKSSKDATRAQTKAADQSAQVQREALQSFEERTEPFRATGIAAGVPLLAELGIEVPQELLDQAGLTEPPDPTQAGQINPLVDFLRREGFEDIQESAAAQGRLRSGGTLEDLTQFNTDLALNAQQQRFNQLFSLLGLGANAATGQGTAALSTGTNLSNILQNRGEAQAQGIVDRANLFNQTLDRGFALGGFKFPEIGRTPPFFPNI